MRRFERPEVKLDQLDTLRNEQRTRLQFDWWCDDKDRARYLEALGGRLEWIYSRAPIEDDPSPPRSVPARQGLAKVALVSDPQQVVAALSNPDDYLNIPYAELGGASFMLALDPPRDGGPDWHAVQRKVVEDLFARFAPGELRRAATWAVEQAAILSLRSEVFDLAEFAEQAALRYFGLVFGYASADHVLLEEAARRGYRALQYVIVGRHFVSEPGTLPAAQLALGKLAARTASLVDEYATLKRVPRQPSRLGVPRPDADWPTGVQPWSEIGLSSLGEPALRQLPELARDLSGQDLCNVIGGLLVGMVGNVQTSICQVVQDLLRAPTNELQRLKDHSAVPALREDAAEVDAAPCSGHTKKPSAGPSVQVQRDPVAEYLRQRLRARPPVPFLPRRTREGLKKIGEVSIEAPTDCILVVPGGGDPDCPWGGSKEKFRHSCVGREFVQPLLELLTRRVVALPDLEVLLDSVTGEVLDPVRLWGFGCVRYGLRYRREKLRVQQPLIVVMPVKSPVAEHAEYLRAVIRTGAPRIQWALDDSSMVHVAWFEFMQEDSLLALRTVYDGDFDTYIQHFALRAGDLFDQLFAHIEGGPPMPVAEHPHEFVETIRRYNRAPLGGYFYSAYPDQKVPRIRGRRG